MTEMTLLRDLLYYRVKDYEVQKRHIERDFVVPHGRTTMEFLGVLPDPVLLAFLPGPVV